MKKSVKSVAGMAIFSALAASLCCITPVLAVLAGSAGLASTFSWLAPARPYLVALTIGILGFAWYQYLRRRKSLPAADDPTYSAAQEDAAAAAIACACEQPERRSFLQSGDFLVIVTLFALLTMGFPYYGGFLLSKGPSPVSSRQTISPVAKDTAHVQQAVLWIPSMDCEACAKGIQYEVIQLPGVVHARVSYPEKKAWVSFDPQLTSLDRIDSVINATGYPVRKQETVSR